MRIKELMLPPLHWGKMDLKGWKNRNAQYIPLNISRFHVYLNEYLQYMSYSPRPLQCPSVTKYATKYVCKYVYCHYGHNLGSC